MQELKTTPAQEAAIHRTIEEVRAAMRSAGPWTLIDPLTAALTADTWDREKLFQAMREKQDSLPNALANAIERLRETLDPEQRRRLVELINQRFNPNRTTHL
jgi:Spy/CpxP family protein refolding chaperone